MKTFIPKEKDIKREWYLVDAKDKTLGRLSTQIADLLRGKKKTIFTPHMDTGDFVVVVNAKKIKVTGKKLTDKAYYRHSGYIGNLKKQTLEELLAKRPEEVLRKSVWGMIPHNKLGKKLIKKLKIYKDENHKHESQKLKVLDIK